MTAVPVSDALVGIPFLKALFGACDAGIILSFVGSVTFPLCLPLHIPAYPGRPASCPCNCLRAAAGPGDGSAASLCACMPQRCPQIITLELYTHSPCACNPYARQSAHWQPWCGSHTCMHMSLSPKLLRTCCGLFQFRAQRRAWRPQTSACTAWCGSCPSGLQSCAPTTRAAAQTPAVLKLPPQLACGVPAGACLQVQSVLRASCVLAHTRGGPCWCGHQTAPSPLVGCVASSAEVHKLSRSSAVCQHQTGLAERQQ